MGDTYVLEEDLEDTTGLLVNKAGDTLDTTTAGETTNSGLSDTCKGVNMLIRKTRSVHRP